MSRFNINKLYKIPDAPQANIPAPIGTTQSTKPINLKRFKVPFGDINVANEPQVTSTYLRPDGTLIYLRPDGSSDYLRP